MPGLIFLTALAAGCQDPGPASVSATEFTRLTAITAPAGASSFRVETGPVGESSCMVLGHMSVAAEGHEAWLTGLALPPLSSGPVQGRPDHWYQPPLGPEGTGRIHGEGSALKPHRWIVVDSQPRDGRLGVWTERTTRQVPCQEL